MKKIIVDPDRCLRCGACISMDQESFEYGEDGVSSPIKETVDEPSEALLSAVEACPAGAITLEDIQEEEEKAA